MFSVDPDELPDDLINVLIVKYHNIGDQSSNENQTSNRKESFSCSESPRIRTRSHLYADQLRSSTRTIRPFHEIAVKTTNKTAGESSTSKQRANIHFAIIRTIAGQLFRVPVKALGTKTINEQIEIKIKDPITNQIVKAMGTIICYARQVPKVNNSSKPTQTRTSSGLSRQSILSNCISSSTNQNSASQQMASSPACRPVQSAPQVIQSNLERHVQVPFRMPDGRTYLLKLPESVLYPSKPTQLVISPISTWNYSAGQNAIGNDTQNKQLKEHNLFDYSNYSKHQIVDSTRTLLNPTSDRQPNDSCCVDGHLKQRSNSTYDRVPIVLINDASRGGMNNELVSNDETFTNRTISTDNLIVVNMDVEQDSSKREQSVGVNYKRLKTY